MKTADVSQKARPTVRSGFMLGGNTGNSEKEFGAVDPFKVIDVEEADTGFVSIAAWWRN
jgi:hypothetical protein